MGGAMQAFLDLDIRRQVADYVDGRRPFAEFYGWAAPVVWDSGSTGNYVADDLAAEIGLRLSEYTSGYWTEEELKAMLRPLSTELELQAPGAAPRLRFTSAAQTSVRQLAAALT